MTRSVAHTVPGRVDEILVRAVDHSAGTDVRQTTLAEEHLAVEAIRQIRVGAGHADGGQQGVRAGSQGSSGRFDRRRRTTRRQRRGFELLADSGRDQGIRRNRCGHPRRRPVVRCGQRRRRGDERRNDIGGGGRGLRRNTHQRERQGAHGHGDHRPERIDREFRAHRDPFVASPDMADDRRHPRWSRGRRNSILARREYPATVTRHRAY